MKINNKELEQKIRLHIRRSEEKVRDYLNSPAYKERMERIKKYINKF